MAVSLTEYLGEIQALTKKNLEILKALNDSFYTKSEHLSVNIDQTQYVIPSFLSLENKLNMLEDNFENLVNAPKTGEAAFDFNGNTQMIEVKGFTNVPVTAFENTDAEKIAAGLKTFSYKKNEVFKDFLTPTPYVKIDLSSLPDDIQTLNVKKIIPHDATLTAALKQAGHWQNADGDNPASVCVAIEYSDVVKLLFPYESGRDYVEYDKVYSMPIRYELGNGKYVIKEIKNNWTDDNFFEHYDLVLDKLTYRIADDTIERSLFEGDYLVTNNDKIKLLIENIYSSTNTVTVKVEQGGFADLCTEADGNVDLSTLKFFAEGNIENMKYLNVPLEEDQYVLVFIAPIQRSSLVQSPWSTGLMLDTFALVSSEDSNKTYQEFYDEMVTNIGDKLFGIVAMAGQDFVNMGEDEYYRIIKSKPVIDPESLKVSLINKHMSNSETVEEIYNLYKQKEDYKTELNAVQKQIDEINSILDSISFENTNANRTIYTDQLASLIEKKKDITSNIVNCIQQITVASTDTDTPVDNPKYHIRGFFDYDKYLINNNLKDQDVIKIDVQYRYKNANRTTGNAETIGDGNVYSDWNIMDSFVSERHPEYNNGTYQYVLDGDTSKENVPSFNQIDIPISQGETVDIRLRVVYLVGYPFVKTTSDWSDIINVEFPVELRKNITVIDILKENNSDAQKEMFRSYLDKNGVITHVGDKLVDQNITYFHQPEHIASGFYTDERRVIPLRDKLQAITDDVISLKDEVFGGSSENIIVSITDGENEVIINPLADNTFILKDFVSADKITSTDPSMLPKVETMLSLKITNASSTHNMKLFSMYPGNYTNVVTKKGPYRYNVDDITMPDDGGLCACLYLDSNTVTPTINDVRSRSHFTPQVYNQWMYFRINNPFGSNNGEDYFYYRNTKETLSQQPDNLYSGKEILGFCNQYYINTKVGRLIYPTFISEYFISGMCVFPHLTDIKDLCITAEDTSNYYKLLKPGESLQVPIHVMYSFSTGNSTIEKTLSFDLRSSLYEDPENYKIKLVANYSNSLSSNVRKISKKRYEPVIIN